MAENDFIAVNQLLSELPLQSLEDQNFNAYYNLLLSLKQANKDYFSDLLPNEISILTNIADSKTHTAFDAQEHLRMAGLAYYPIELPDLSVLPHNQSGNKTVILTPTIASLSSNPITSWGRITYDLPTKDKAVLHIFDITGKKVVEKNIEGKGDYIIEAKNFESGMYLYVVEQKGTILLKEKIFVVK